MSARKYTLELTAIELDALCRMLWCAHQTNIMNSGNYSPVWSMGWHYCPDRPNRPKPWYRAAAAIGRVFRKVDNLTGAVWAAGGMPRRPEAL